jgi:integrase
VDAANKKLTEAGIASIGSITFHSLRRTYASLRCACGDDVRYAADQLGHEDSQVDIAGVTRRRRSVATDSQART